MAPGPEAAAMIFGVQDESLLRPQVASGDARAWTMPDCALSRAKQKSHRSQGGLSSCVISSDTSK